LQLYSPLQKNEPESKIIQTIDAKFLLSAGGIKNSLEKEDEKFN